MSNWYSLTKLAAELNPDIPTPWEQNPTDPKWNTWQKFERQRQLPFMSEPERPYQRQYKDPDAEMYGYDEDAPAAEGGNLYHVTTNLSGIKIDGHLKSRRQLGDTMGLGGGPKDEARGLVSLTYDYSRAKHIYEEMHFVAAVVRGKIPASKVYQHFSSYVEDPDEGLSPFDRMIRDHGVSKRLILEGDVAQIGAILDQKIVTPRDRYAFLQECEQAIINKESADNEYSENVYQQSIIGFTSPFEAMQRLNPSQLAIIQCVLRKGAEVEHVMHEMEIRAEPQDLAVVRFMQPNPGY